MWFWVGAVLAIVLVVLYTKGRNLQAEQAAPGSIKTVMTKGNLTTDQEVQRYVTRGWELVSTTPAGRKKVLLTFRKL